MATYRTCPPGVVINCAVVPCSEQRTVGGAGISTRCLQPHAKRASNAIDRTG